MNQGTDTNSWGNEGQSGEAPELAYQECLRWLYRQSRGEAARDPARMLALAEALGLKQPPQYVRVVGTNGKGTVTAMTAAAVAASGVRSGCFISPHVEDFRERISVDGEPIGKAEVVAFVERVRAAPLPLVPAFFELTLALALDHFERRGVQFAAVEAGVGAKRDATAILENVAAVAITPIALDHQETLGHTLALIAADKAAAMRPGAPAVSAPQEPEVVEVLTALARSQGSPLYIDTPADPLFARPAPAPPESDPVRLRNGRVAAALLRSLTGLPNEEGVVPEDAVAEGLALPPLPGRGERFPIDGKEVLLDGAHDPAAARALVERAGRDYVLLFGSLPRKQGEETLRELEKRSTTTVITDAGGEASTLPRGEGRSYLASPSDALRAALSACPPGGLVVVGGSLYLAGELRPLLRAMRSEGAEPGTMSRVSLEDR